jgi:hypothetical protein
MPRKFKFLNPIAGWFVRANTYALQKLSEGNYQHDEFLSGACRAFESVVQRFAKGNVEGFENMMTERMKKGFEEVFFLFVCCLRSVAVSSSVLRASGKTCSPFPTSA